MLRRLRIENLVLIREAELELAAGLNAITGETGAGKTILAQAVGLLLGVKGDAAAVGHEGDEAYVEAELEPPAGFWDEEGMEALADLRPAGEQTLVLARRIFPDGRTRAYAWGRGAAREELAAAGERLIAMSGQFEQRRLGRPSYGLEVLDAFIGAEAARLRGESAAAWRELGAARRRHERLTRDADAERERVEELRALAADTAGMEPGDEVELRAERERLRHVVELGAGTLAAAEALAPEEGSGAVGLSAQAQRALAPLSDLAPELARAREELADLEGRLLDTGRELRTFLASLEVEPGRLDEVEAELDRLAAGRRRFRCGSYEELLERAADARAELEQLEAGGDPAQEAAREVAAAEAQLGALQTQLSSLRRAAAGPFAAAVSAELAGLGMGEGELVANVREREPGATGADAVTLLIRPNPGLPLAPVAETASGGERSRIALAIAAVAGGETMVFDEIDAGVGGETAHAVGETLRRLAERAQVVAITHLPQIASLAERHFRVEKIPGDPTHTRIEQLGDAERREELQRMLGGREFLSSVR